MRQTKNILFCSLFFLNFVYFCSPFRQIGDCNKQTGTIAQLVEQRTENPCVAGSIPAGTTEKSDKLSRFFSLTKIHVLQVLYGMRQIRPT
jgi:hypothetical protein